VESGRFDEQLKALPRKPGVYLFRDSAGKVLYVGKATNLHSRVRSYFGAPQSTSPKTENIVSLTGDIDFIVTDSEQEALILECILIKKHSPPYNVRFKDDKSYPYIKVSLNEEWPRVFATRRFTDDGGRYFGPYASARSVKRTLDLLKQIFRFCSPRSVITGRKARPCFDYYINRCSGACSGEISQEEYRRIIDEVVLFLQGKQEMVIRDLRNRMETASHNLEFEKAVFLRDQLQAVESIAEGQKVISTGTKDMDVVAFARNKNEACVQIFFYRGRKLIGKENFVMEGTLDEEPGSITAGFIKQFYDSAPYIPPEILLGTEPQDSTVIRAWLKKKRGGKVNLKVPIRGEKRKLVAMVAQNAAQVMEQMHAKWLSDTGKIAASLTELQERLNLPRLPNRIECYDISNISGSSSVGSMVVFENGRPKPSLYRRFRIKTIAGIDDYSMMQEVLRRRFKRISDQDQSNWAVVPDLVLIDGGRGHLSSAIDVLHELDIDSIPIASLAKENEEVFLPDKREQLILPRKSTALYLLQRIRDEAHRFALSYHLKVRRKATMASATEVPGVGPKRRKALIKHFGSMRAVKDASVEEIAAVPGITKSLAKTIKECL
jgi:excinuclease ABC subunit C